MTAYAGATDRPDAASASRGAGRRACGVGRLRIQSRRRHMTRRPHSPPPGKGAAAAPEGRSDDRRRAPALSVACFERHSASYNSMAAILTLNLSATAMPAVTARVVRSPRTVSPVGTLRPMLGTAQFVYAQ